MADRKDLDILRSDVEIPDIVMKKADAAFAQIKAEQEKTQEQAMGNTERVNIEGHGRRTGRKNYQKLMIASIAAALALGTGVFASDSIFHWSRGLTGALQVEEAQKEAAEKSGLADEPGNVIEILSEGEEGNITSVEKDGITVSVEQTIVDNYSALVALKISGMELPEGSTPMFGHFAAEIEGVDNNCSASFYGGMITGPDGMAVYDDGTPIDWDIIPDGTDIARYVDENGDLEYDITFVNNGEAGAMIGKPIRVSLGTLGYEIGREEVKALTEETFELNWTLQGSKEIRTCELSEPIGDIGATVLGVELSPISIRMTMDWPLEETTEEIVDDDGNITMEPTYKEAPWCTGLLMKDGTLLLSAIGGAGFDSYTEDGVWIRQYQIERIIDPEQVEGLLFPSADLIDRVENAEENGEKFDYSKLTKDDFYIVSL